MRAGCRARGRARRACHRCTIRLYRIRCTCPRLLPLAYPCARGIVRQHAFHVCVGMPSKRSLSPHCVRCQRFKAARWWQAPPLGPYGMVRVAPGSRSPFWSQNQVKVLIDRESSFYISSTKNPSQIFFLKFDSVFCAASAPSVVMLRRLPASILLLSASTRIGFCNKSVCSRRLLCCISDGAGRWSAMAGGSAWRSAAYRLRLADELALQLQGRSCPPQCAACHAGGPWPRAAAHRCLKNGSA